MITGIRSALFCDKVENGANGLSYIGVRGDVLTADSRPGLIEAWSALQVEVDRKVTPGRIAVSADGYSESFPFMVPAGVALTGMAFRLIVPVLSAGPSG